MTDIFLIKLFLTPLFVAALTLIGRRWGAAASGAVAGLPLTSGPVSVFLALEQGKAFAAHAATGTLAGLIAVAAFCFAYAFVSSRRNWIASVLAGVAAFFVFASLLLRVPLGLAATFIIVACFLMNNLVGNAKAGWCRKRRQLKAARNGTFLCASESQRAWYFFSPLSRQSLAHTQQDWSRHFQSSAESLRSSHTDMLERTQHSVSCAVLVIASLAFAIFFLVVGIMLIRDGCAATYLIATIAALSTNAFLFMWLRRKS